MTIASPPDITKTCAHMAVYGLLANTVERAPPPRRPIVNENQKADVI